MVENLENELSRQIATYGMDTMVKLVKMNVFIHGLRGLGIETAKNIILAGPRQVTLFDDTKVDITDLGSNFYLKPSDVGTLRRDEACVGLLKELNPRVEISVANFDPRKDTTAKLMFFDVICITEICSLSYLNSVDELCRKNSAGFIYSASTGMSGFVFSDFGIDHVVKDTNGEECKQSMSCIASWFRLLCLRLLSGRPPRQALDCLRFGCL